MKVFSIEISFSNEKCLIANRSIKRPEESKKDKTFNADFHRVCRLPSSHRLFTIYRLTTTLPFLNIWPPDILFP